MQKTPCKAEGRAKKANSSRKRKTRTFNTSEKQLKKAKDSTSVEEDQSTVSEVIDNDSSIQRTPQTAECKVVPPVNQEVMDTKTGTSKSLEKKNQFVVGVNIVTRCLERDELRTGMVCLSARPAFVTQHIMMLSATRSCPILALPNLSEVLAPHLGIKSALAIGFKVSQLRS